MGVPDTSSTFRMKHLSTFFLLVSIGFVQQTRAINITLINNQQSACSAPTGALDIIVTGGSPPYTFLWSNGATTEDIQNLTPGLYSVTVIDALSQTTSGSWNVVSTQLTCPPSAQDGHASCIGQTGGEVQSIEWGINGTPPYSYSPPPAGYDPQGDPYFTFPFAPIGTDVTLNVTDANGCTGVLQETVMGPQMYSDPYMVLDAVQGSCSGGNGGSVIISNVYDGSFFQAPYVTLLDDQDNPLANDFGGSSVTFIDLAPGDYHVLREWDPIYMAYPCDGNPYDRLDFVVPDLGPNCGNVSGNVFIDNDQDCGQDPTEVGVPYQVLEIQPGPVYTITDAVGHYSTDIVDGSYQLAQTDPTLVQLCPAAAPVPFTIASNVAVIDLADSSTAPLNMRVQLNAGILRPGFTSTYWGLVRNTSPQLAGLVTVQVVLDPVLSYVAATPAPTTVAGNVLTWNFGAFTAYQQQALTIQVLTPVGTPLGTSVSTTAEVSAALPEADLSDNLITEAGTVTGSFDPNDKTVRTSTGWSDTQYIIGDDDWLDYTIRFQNTGTDTAFTVAITDTLDADLDMGSFQQGVASHGFTVQFLPGRIVRWTFANILLPDSNTNEQHSHGLVSFRIRPVQPLLPGTVISNNADIFFDFNQPVRTNDAVVIAETSTQVQVQGQAQVQGLNVFPNPATDQLNFALPGTAGPYVVELIGVDGRVFSRERTAASPVDVSMLRPGMYGLRVNGSTVRFVKN